MMLVSPVLVPCNQVVPAADLEAAVPALVEHALVVELVHLAHERVESSSGARPRTVYSCGISGIVSENRQSAAAMKRPGS